MHNRNPVRAPSSRARLTAPCTYGVVPDAAMTADARQLMSDQLKDVGFSDVTMLSKPSEPADIVEPGPRVVAA